MRHSILYSFLATIFTAASAHGTDDLAKLECDLIDTTEVYWSALDENVTLRTDLKSGENPWPDGTLKLILSDGTMIDLGKGSKYIDDFDPATPPTCQDHLHVAQSATLGSLGYSLEVNQTPYTYPIGAPEFRSMRDLEAALTEARSCTETEGRRCSEEEFLIERVEQIKVSPALFTELIILDAPIIEVRSSTYYISVYAFHPHTKTLHELYPNGC